MTPGSCIAVEGVTEMDGERSLHQASRARLPTRISIALATYNGERYLQEQLDSFLQQTTLPDELVVCDDASTDGTVEILEAFRHTASFVVRIFRNDHNVGHVRNFERALSLCEGDYVFLSDQDDTWVSTKLEVVMDAFMRNPGIDVVINDASYVDAELNSLGATVLQRVLSVGAKKSGHIAGACTAVTRHFLGLVLPFPESTCSQHDVCLHRWANILGNKHVLEGSLQTWRIHGDNSTSRNEMNSSEFESFTTRYARYKHVDVRTDYLAEAEEYVYMLRQLRQREPALAALSEPVDADELAEKIESAIAIYQNRAKLCEAGWAGRKLRAVSMLRNGEYRYFKGFYSFLKDLLR